jgi:hypothetical protein
MGSSKQNETQNETRADPEIQIAKQVYKPSTKKERSEGLVKVKGGFLSLFKERYPNMKTIVSRI